MFGYNSSQRATLKEHLDAQWIRGYGGSVKARTAKKAKAPKDAPREYRDASEPVTLGEVWPK